MSCAYLINQKVWELSFSTWTQQGLGATANTADLAANHKKKYEAE